MYLLSRSVSFKSSLRDALMTLSGINVAGYVVISTHTISHWQMLNCFSCKKYFLLTSK